MYTRKKIKVAALWEWIEMIMRLWVKDVDPSEETELKVKDFIDQLAVIGHIGEGTKHFIETKTNETKPGPYYEQPKTHKFNDEEHDMSEGFPARGIISCNKSPTEALQDYVKRWRKIYQI